MLSNTKNGTTQASPNTMKTVLTHSTKKIFNLFIICNGKKERKQAYDTKIREALEIRRHGCGPGKGLNEDMGAYIRTDMWDPVLSSI